MTEYLNFETIVGIITIISVLINIIQYYRRQQEYRSLRAQVQGGFNSQFLVARACTRARDSDPTGGSQTTSTLLRELDYIRGISDAARSSLIAFSREHLGFLPKFEHPAEPGKEQPKNVIYGQAPDKNSEV